MGKRRRVDILADVLEVAVKGAKKTRIMNNANLSHSLLEKYLEDTVGIGFLQLNNGSYETTEKGRKFLNMYARFSSMHAKIRKDLEASESELNALERFCDPANSNG
jgi:predicted transcriptional regulator